MEPSPRAAVDVPAVDVRAVDLPAADAPAVDAPAADPPAVDAPAVDAPAVDLMLGVVACAMAPVGALLYVTRPVAGLVLRPPLVPTPLQPHTWLVALARQGHAFRERATPQVEAVLTQVIDGVVAHIDVNALLDRLDLNTMARQVVADIDLAEIIRDSTGTLASETVRGLRMQGIEADERVSRIVDKALLRRNVRKTQVRPRADEPVP
jgi:hypothetical protein